MAVDRAAEASSKDEDPHALTIRDSESMTPRHYTASETALEAVPHFRAARQSAPNVSGATS
jgi:hypothetical protein